MCREGNGSADGSVAGGGANAIVDERSGWLNPLAQRKRVNFLGRSLLSLARVEEG